MSFDTKINMPTQFATGDMPSATSDNRGLQWARDMVMQRTAQKHNIPLYYREILAYMITKLGGLAYLNSELELIAIKCIHSNPERTIAKLKQENNIILPIISIHQNSSDNADKRRRNNTQIISESFWSENKKRAFRILSIAPRAVDIEYGINIWAKYKANLDQIVEQIRLLFNPSLKINTPSTTTALAFLEQETDSSTFEVDDREERLIRRSFVVKLEGWVPTPKFLVTSTGEIEEFNMDTTIY